MNMTLSAWTRLIRRHALAASNSKRHLHDNGRSHVQYNIDVKAIRADPAAQAENCRLRNYPELIKYPERIVDAHHRWLDLDVQSLPHRRRLKEIQKSISFSKKDRSESTRTNALTEARNLNTLLVEMKSKQAELASTISNLASALPNSTSIETPSGGEPRVLQQSAVDQEVLDTAIERDHVRIGRDFALLDLENATKVSGWGFYYLLNEGEMLEQALIQYARSVVRAHGFTTVAPPTIVYEDIGSACGFRPKDQNDEQQIYTVLTKGEKPRLSLAGTAEIPFAAIKQGMTLDAATLPYKVAGSSRCFRAEAGARGRDSRGLYRVHEFTKVEMFAWTAPGDEGGVFDEMVGIQKYILESLGLPLRVLEMPAYDLGAPAHRKQDIEVYFPSRGTLPLAESAWGEVTSTSNCLDYQTRRLGTKIRRKTIDDSPETVYASTINGTAMAVPRVLAAILENGWTRDNEGREFIKVPEPLWPFMESKRIIEPRCP